MKRPARAVVAHSWPDSSGRSSLGDRGTTYAVCHHSNLRKRRCFKDPVPPSIAQALGHAWAPRTDGAGVAGVRLRRRRIFRLSLSPLLWRHRRMFQYDLGVALWARAGGGFAINVRYKGKITNWNSERGFGFVTPAGGGEHVFLYITAMIDRRRPLAEGDMVTYDLAFDERRRPRAASVRRSAPTRPKSKTLRSATPRFRSPGLGVALYTLCRLGHTGGSAPASCHYHLRRRQHPYVSGLLARQVGGPARGMEEEGKLTAPSGSGWRVARCGSGSAGTAPQVEKAQLSGCFLGDRRRELCRLRVASHGQRIAIFGPTAEVIP